jgi:hypothetical protein
MTQNEGIEPQTIEVGDSGLVAQRTAVPSIVCESNWPQTRIELLGWFRESAPAVADAYRGSVRLLDDVTFPGRVQFISHAVRDIADRLVFILDPQKAPARVEYENELDEIQLGWPELDSFSQTVDASVVETCQISVKVARQIDHLINEHRQRRFRPNAYQTLIQILASAQEPGSGGNERIATAFQKTRKWFMVRTHLRVSGIPEPDEAELRRQFEAFERILHSFVGNFVRVHGLLLLDG